MTIAEKTLHRILQVAYSLEAASHPIPPIVYTRTLNPNGIYVTVGGSLVRIFQALILGRLISMISKKNIRIVALKSNKDLAYLNELFEAGKVKPVIDGPYKLSEVPKALRYFGEGKHKGKVVIALEANDNI